MTEDEAGRLRQRVAALEVRADELRAELTEAHACAMAVHIGLMMALGVIAEVLPTSRPALQEALQEGERLLLERDESGPPGPVDLRAVQILRSISPDAV